jgi:paraquat-inducible protein B
MLKRTLVSFMLLLVVCGCKENVLNVKIKYDQIHGLEQGDGVVFEQNHVGQVASIFYGEDGYYMVAVAIRKAFANAATEHSMFVITEDPQSSGKKAVEIIQFRKGGLPLEDGATVKGSSRIAKEEGLEKKFEAMKKGFEHLFEELGELPDSEQFKELERELERLAEQLKGSGESLRQKMEQELLPRLKEEIEKLREQLQKFGRQGEAKELEDHLERIRKI